MFEYLREHLKETLEYWDSDVVDDDVLDFSKQIFPEVLKGCDHFFLYHYASADYYNIRNVEMKSIHLSPNGVMNDIYEGLPSGNESISYDKLQKMWDMAYMTCLSEAHDNNLMWSHYADGHKGFCIRYDLKRLRQDSYQIREHIFPVIYEEKRRIFKQLDSLLECHQELKKAIKEEYVYDYPEPLDDILPMFLTKGLDWEYEREWRIIFTLKQMYDRDDPILYTGNLYFPCISALYLGYRIDPIVKQDLIEISRRISGDVLPVEVYQAGLKEDSYDVLFERIDQ